MSFLTRPPSYGKYKKLSVLLTQQEQDEATYLSCLAGKGKLETASQMTISQVKPLCRELVYLIRYFQRRHLVHAGFHPSILLLARLNNQIYPVLNSMQSIIDLEAKDAYFSRDHLVVESCPPERLKALCTTHRILPPRYNHSLTKPLMYKADSWGLGILLFALTQNQLPYAPSLSQAYLKTGQELLLDKMKKQIQEKLKDLNADFKTVLHGLLDFNPETRWDCERVLSSKWMLCSKPLSLEVENYLIDSINSIEEW